MSMRGTAAGPGRRYPGRELYDSQGKPVARRGRKARDLRGGRPAAGSLQDKSPSARDTEVATQMPSKNSILERLRWKVGLGLVIVAAGFAAHSAPATDSVPNVARSSWAAETDVARSSWGAAELEVDAS